MIYTALILLIIGLFLLALELFVPSAGSLGIVAGCLMLAAVVIAFREDYQTGGLMLLTVLLVVPAMLFMMIKIWPYTPIGRRILTDEKVLTDILPQSDFYQKRSKLVGKRGVAKTKMLLSGQVLIDGEKFDAVSDGFAIEPDDAIRVVAVKQNRIYVQPAEESESHRHDSATSHTAESSRQSFDLDADSIDDLLSE